MQNLKRITISKMNLFNQNYHIQVRRHKLQLKKNVVCKKGSMETGVEFGFQFRRAKA